MQIQSIDKISKFYIVNQEKFQLVDSLEATLLVGKNKGSIVLETNNLSTHKESAILNNKSIEIKKRTKIGEIISGIRIEKILKVVYL